MTAEPEEFPEQDAMTPVATRQQKTVGGIYYDPFDMKVEDIDFHDIAHHLSMIVRYGGATRSRWDVAAHSVAISRAAEVLGANPFIQMGALLHDAPEAYIGDVVSPIKHTPEFSFFRDLDDKIALVVSDALAFQHGICLPIDIFFHPVIRRLDSEILLWEKALFRDQQRPVQSPVESMTAWTQRFAHLITACRAYQRTLSS